VINYALDIAIESTMLHAVEADSGARNPERAWDLPPLLACNCEVGAHIPR
jgi:hypothetical protein